MEDTWSSSSHEDDNFIPVDKLHDETPSEILPPWHRLGSIQPKYPLKTLHNEILDLCDLLSPTSEEKAQATTAITYVKRVVRETLGVRADVRVFGSQLTGLVLPNSDVDAVIVGKLPPDAFMRMTHAMRIRNRRQEVFQVVAVRGAKVPLVKFVHASSRVQVDLSFGHDTGVRSGEAAIALMRQMQPVRPLVMVLKAYMGQRKLNETFGGGMGSFLLQLMVVALVQKCGRDAERQGLDPPTNLGFFLDEFFDFYGNRLNYATTGITLLGENGGGFFNKKDIGWDQKGRPFLLCIQNPHQPEVDVGTNSYQVGVCKRSFKATSLRLKSAFQRVIAAERRGETAPEMGGFLKYVVNPDGQLVDRILPPPTFCTRIFDERQGDDRQQAKHDVFGSDDTVPSTKKARREKVLPMKGKYKSTADSHPFGKKRKTNAAA